ncbi:MAG TPA: hypothetical protein PKC91_06960 [Ignavibacteria bacterium]|nr:hypothetical protein [Ignavibacteria bacterium]
MSGYRFSNFCAAVKFIFITAVFLMTNLFFMNNAKSQTNTYSAINTNLPTEFEKNSEQVRDKNISNDFNAELIEKRHKEALESGNSSEAERTRSELDDLYSRNDILQIRPTGISCRRIIEPPAGFQTDWSVTGKLVHTGDIKENSGPVQIEYKFGEDNNIYAVLNAGSPGGGLYFYRSADYGKTWIFITGFIYSAYISGISAKIESRTDSNPDSTRIICFFTMSNTSTNEDGYLAYISVRRNGTGVYSGTIAHPGTGNQFNKVSAVSDGAFYSNATYFGVVCTETNNSNSAVQNLRFYRTIDWGATWTATTLATGFNDFNPSADYKEGTSDSIYIAVERRFPGSSSQLRVIAARWSPVSSYFTYYLTSSSEYNYTYPQLSIMQKSNADSMIVTSKRNDNPVYHAKTASGNIWYIDYQLDSLSLPNTNFVSCSSFAKGSEPFTVCWSNSSYGLVFTRKGRIGAMNRQIQNSSSISATIMVKCINYCKSNSNFTSFIFSGGGQHNAFSNSEGIKLLSLKSIPQGFYNSFSNRLIRKDTVSVFIRNSFSPYEIIESGKGIIDSVSFNCDIQFTGIPDGDYYIQIKHRNCLETWSSAPVSFLNYSASYDLTNAVTKAFGSNMYNVDTSPYRFGLYSGETNNDGIIDLTDVIDINNDASVFQSGYNVSDVNGDNLTDLTDIIIAGNNSNNFVSRITP